VELAVDDTEEVAELELVLELVPLALELELSLEELVADCGQGNQGAGQRGAHTRLRHDARSKARSHVEMHRLLPAGLRCNTPD
jgi:hypothetical protein